MTTDGLNSSWQQPRHRGLCSPAPGGWGASPGFLSVLPVGPLHSLLSKSSQASVRPPSPLSPPLESPGCRHVFGLMCFKPHLWCPPVSRVNSLAVIDHKLLGTISSRHLPVKRTAPSLCSPWASSCLFLSVSECVSLSSLGTSGPCQSPPLAPTPADEP